MTGPIQSADVEQSDLSAVFLFFGIALVILGTLAIFGSVFVTIGTVLLFGALLVAAGIAETIHILRSHQRRNIWPNVLSAIVYLVAGGFTIYNPLAGALSFTLIISGFLVAAGLIRCFYGITHRTEPMWGWFLFGGIINIMLGAMIALGLPATGLWIIGLFVGVEMIIHGCSWIALSTVIKDIEKSVT